TSRSSAARTARRARPAPAAVSSVTPVRLAVAESTAHDCAMESIRHSRSFAEPRREPSSWNARRYQAPSHALASIFARKDTARLRQELASLPSPFQSQSTANRCIVAHRNQPSQTLSPRPSARGFVADLGASARDWGGARSPPRGRGGGGPLGRGWRRATEFDEIANS